MTQTANKPVTTEELGWIEREVLPEGSPERSEEFWRSMVNSLVHTLREHEHDLALLAHAIEYIENQGDDDAWQEFLEKKADEEAA